MDGSESRLPPLNLAGQNGQWFRYGDQTYPTDESQYSPPTPLESQHSTTITHFTHQLTGLGYLPSTGF